MKTVSVTKEFISDNGRPFDSCHASNLIQLENGDILVAWFGGSWEKEKDVRIWTSRRTAGVWQKEVCVAEEGTEAMWNPVLFQTKSGQIQLYYKKGENCQDWITWVRTSDDNGDSWSEPRELVEGDRSGGRGPVKNKPVYLENGTILAPASTEKGGLWDCFADISYDNGLTWVKSSNVPLRRAGHNIQMLHYPPEKHRCFGAGIIQPAFWEDKEHHVHMLARSTSSRIFRSDSTDGGKSWSLAYETALPNNNSGIDLVKLPDGKLVLVYNPTENLPNFHKGPRTPLSVAYSEDNGESWRKLVTLEDEPGVYAYPAVICNNKNEIMITYTWKRETIAYVCIKYQE